MDKEPPDPPIILPRIGYDPNSPEQRAEKHWHDNFPPSPGGFPPQPETWLDLDSRSVHLKAYVAKTGKESIAGEQAWRELAVVNAKITDLVWAAKEKLKAENPETADEAAREQAWREKREAKQRAWIDKEIAEREAKAAKRRVKVAKAEEEAAAREHADDKTESELEEEAARERQLERIGGHLHEHWEREGVFQDKVVPLRREERVGTGRGERVEDREDPEFKPPQRLDLSRWSVPPEPLVWLVPGLLRPGVSTLFSGRGGAGKGIVSMTLATAMMPGQGRKGFLGMGVLEGPVFGLFCEDEPQILQLRQLPIDRFYSIPHGRYSDERAYYSLVGRFSALAIADKRTNQLLRTPLWDWLLAQAKAFPRLLTILDPVSRLFIGDLNDPLQAVQFSAMLDELAVVSGGAVLANFHPSRSALKDTGASDGVGHSPQWVNAFRIAAFLDVPAPEADPNFRMLRTTKINDGSKTDIPLRWDNGLFCVDRATKPKAGAAHREQFLELFDRAWSRGIWVSDKQSSPHWAPRRLLEAAALDAEDKALRSGMRAAMMALMGEGVLVVGSYRGADRHPYDRLERAGTGAGTGAGTAGTSV